MAKRKDASVLDALGEWLLPLIDSHDTVYATDFKEDVFRSLAFGTLQADVRRQLGEPLSTKAFPDGVECW